MVKFDMYCEAQVSSICCRLDVEVVRKRGFKNNSKCFGVFE